MKPDGINTIIEGFNALQLEEKEIAVEVINKAYAEANRLSILSKSRKALQNFKKGKVKKGNLQDLYNDLEND